MDEDFVGWVEGCHVNTHARQFLISEFDLIASEDLMQAAQTFLSAMNAIHAWEPYDMGFAPPGLLAVQNFATGILDSLSCYDGDTRVHRLGKYIPFLL